jgi:hypothetical protein
MMLRLIVHMPALSWKVAGSILACGVVSLAHVADARADDVSRAVKRLIAVDQRIHIMALEFQQTPRKTDAELASQRVVDAEALLARHDYDRAIPILLDVIAKWPATRAADDAR